MVQISSQLKTGIVSFVDQKGAVNMVPIGPLAWVTVVRPEGLLCVVAIFGTALFAIVVNAVVLHFWGKS